MDIAGGYDLEANVYERYSRLLSGSTGYGRYTKICYRNTGVWMLLLYMIWKLRCINVGYCTGAILI